MIDDPVPTMPEMVPASRPTMRTKRKPKDVSRGSPMLTSCYSRPVTTPIITRIGADRADQGSCHCGHTQFEVSEAPVGVTRCTCSLCAKRGALWAYYTPAQFLPDVACGKRRDLSVGQLHRQASLLREMRLRNLFRSRPTGRPAPNFDNPKVAVNSRLFDDFDLMQCR